MEAPSKRRALESFNFEIDDPDTEDFLPPIHQLWELGQQDASFFESMTSLRHVGLHFVDLPDGFKTWMLPDSLESLKLLCKSEDTCSLLPSSRLHVLIEFTLLVLDLSNRATRRLDSIPWNRLSNLTSLQIDLFLGVEQGPATLLTWNTRAPNNFALSFSDLPSLQSLKIHVNFDCELPFNSNDLISGAMNHVWKESIDRCFVPPRFAGLKKLEIQVTISVGLETVELLKLMGSGLKDMIKSALPSLFGTGGRVSQGLDVVISTYVD